MSQRSSVALKAGTQVLLALCVCLIGPGIFAVTRGPVSVQSFFLAPNCGTNNTTNCCPGCLSMSPEEYALTLAIPPWVAFPLIFFSGAIIDFFGLPTAAVLISLFSLVGAVLHAIAPYIVTWHTTMVALFTVGTLNCTVALFWFHSFFQFLAVRYFETKWHTLVMSVIYSSSTMGAVLAASLSPRLAEDLGISLSLWSMVWETSLAPLAAVAIFFVFKCRADMLGFERNRRSSQTKKVEFHSLSFIFKSIKAFEFDYWLITVVVSLTAACVTPYMTNAQLLLTSLFDISIVEVADNLSIGWIVQIVVLPLLGLLDSRFKSHLVTVFLSLIVEAVVYLALLVPPGSPQISCVLLPLPYAILHMAISPQIKPFVPEQALGLASSVHNSFNAFFCSIVILILGGVLGDSNPRRAASNALYVLVSLVCLKAALLVLLVIRLRLHSQRRKRDEYELLMDNDN